MTEKLISPTEYTQDILESISIIKNRMDTTLINYSDDDIIVIEYKNIIYILANPILRYGTSFVDGKEVKVPVYNIELIYYYGDYNSEQMDDSIRYTYKIPIPRMHILRPDLCARLENSEYLINERVLR